MYHLTNSLLAGSKVSPATHPVLVALLELAASRPGFPATQDGHNARMRHQRKWGRIQAAFRACCEASVSDAALVACLPFPGLLWCPGFSAAPWVLDESRPPETVRDVVAGLLEVAASASGAVLHDFPIKTIKDVRRAQKANRLPSFLLPDVERRGRVETRLLKDGHFVVSWLLCGERVFSLLQADAAGRVRAVAHRGSKLQALREVPA